MSIEFMLNIKISTNLLLIPIVPLLAACGGGGGTTDGGGGGMTNDPPSLTNSQRATLLDNTFDEINDLIDGQPDVYVLEDPPRGAAQYSGTAYAAIGVGSHETGENLDHFVVYLGELELEANFAGGNILGDATNFIILENPQAFFETDADPVAGGDVTGKLIIAGPQSVGSEATYDVIVNGELSGADGSYLNYDALGASAAFYGANADTVSVYGLADTTIDDNISGFIEFGGVAKEVR